MATLSRFQLGVAVNKVESGHDGNGASCLLGSWGFQGPNFQKQKQKSKNEEVSLTKMDLTEFRS